MNNKTSYFQEHCEKHDGRDFHGVHSVAVHPMRELVGEQRAAGERSCCAGTPARAHSQRPDFHRGGMDSSEKGLELGEHSSETGPEQQTLLLLLCAVVLTEWWGQGEKSCVGKTSEQRNERAPCTPGCAYNSM